jgi:hypothetical protein
MVGVPVNEVGSVLIASHSSMGAGIPFYLFGFTQGHGAAPSTSSADRRAPARLEHHVDAILGCGGQVFDTFRHI